SSRGRGNRRSNYSRARRRRPFDHSHVDVEHREGRQTSPRHPSWFNHRRERRIAMLRVGLTGGVACGKSTVAHMMEERGAFLIQADHIAHDLMKPGEPVYEEVVKRFGPGIVN